MASINDYKSYNERLARDLARTNRPAPVYKPSVPYVVKEAGTAIYNTTSRNMQTQRQSSSGKTGSGKNGKY
jgi:hypothetical protein